MFERLDKLAQFLNHVNFRRLMGYRSFRRKFLIGQILPATLGVMVAFLIIFAIVQNRMLYTARKAAIDVNQQVTNTSDYIWLMTLSQVYVLNNDSDIINWLNSDSIQPNKIFEALIQQRLMRAKESNPLIWSINAYNAVQDRFIQSEASPLSLSRIPDRRLAQLLSYRLTERQFFPRQIIEKRSNRLVKTNVITAIIPSDSPGSALIINISVDNQHKYNYGNDYSMEQLFGNTLSINRLGKLLIIDKNGTVFFDEFSGQFGQKINQSPYIARITQSKVPADSFAMRINYKKCLITFATSEYLDWKIINIIPYTSLLTEAYLLRNVFLLICVLICSLVCWFSLFYSGSLIRPVNILVQQAKKFLPNSPVVQTDSDFDEIGTVSQALDTIAAKAEALRQEAETTRTRLQEELIKNLMIGIPFEENDYFSVYQELVYMFSGQMMIAVYALDALPWHQQSYENAISPGLKFSEILGLTKEKVKGVLDSQFSYFSIVTGLDQLAVVVSSTQFAAEDFAMKFKQSCREIQESIHQKTNYSITIGLGSVVSNLEKLNESYEAALDAVSCRFKLGRGLVFDQDMVNQDQSALNYPKDYEKLILDGLRIGSLCEVKKAFSRFIIAITPYSDAEIMVAINQLIFTSARVIEEKADTHKSGLPTTNKRLIKRDLDKLQTLDDITHYLTNWYQTNIEIFDLNRSRRRIDIVEKVKLLIVEKYNNPNLTLQELAEAVCLSHSHLRALFRDMVGETLADYIAEYRLQRAAELLIQTEKSVAEIATTAGLSSANYFHNVFRRRFGETPVEYRRNHRK